MSDMDTNSSSVGPEYNELMEAMTKGHFESRARPRSRGFNLNNTTNYLNKKAIEVANLAYARTDKTYMNEYQNIILQRSFIYGVNNIKCEHWSRLELIVSNCLMNIEPDPGNDEEKIILKVIHDGMFTQGGKGSVKKVNTKNIYEYIENICYNPGTKGYPGGRMEEIMDGIIEVWCDNIAKYNFKNDYVCYNQQIFNNEEELSKYIQINGNIKKVPYEEEELYENHPGYTWKEWYDFYKTNNLLQWIAYEFQNAKEASPFPSYF